MLNVPTDNQLWSQVEELGWRLDRQGTTLPLTDLIIARIARCESMPPFSRLITTLSLFPGCAALIEISD